MTQTTSKDVRILAIALSTGGFGFVVMEGKRTIIEFGRRVADGDKNAQSLAKMKKLLNFYRPDDWCFKTWRPKVHAASQDQNAKPANQKGDGEAKDSGKTYFRKAIADLAARQSTGTKQEMAATLAAQFPDELASRLPPKRKLWTSEDARMDIFDAMALAVVFWMKGAKSGSLIQ